MILLDESWFPQINEIMQEAFPIEERRKAREQYELFQKPNYHVYGMLKQTQVQAFIATWELTNIQFVEHLATTVSMRGTGIGKDLIETFIASCTKPIVLEVEPPTNDITMRRIEFYKRIGFQLFDHIAYAQPSFHGHAPLPLCLMVYPKNFDDAFIHMCIQQLYEQVYEEKLPCI